jgi:hypothetical protein
VLAQVRGGQATVGQIELYNLERENGAVGGPKAE